MYYSKSSQVIRTIKYTSLEVLTIIRKGPKEKRILIKNEALILILV